MAPGRNAGRNSNRRLRGFVDRSLLRKLVRERYLQLLGRESKLEREWKEKERLKNKTKEKKEHKGAPKICVGAKWKIHLTI